MGVRSAAQTTVYWFAIVSRIYHHFHETKSAVELVLPCGSESAGLACLGRRYFRTSP